MKLVLGVTGTSLTPYGGRLFGNKANRETQSWEQNAAATPCQILLSFWIQLHLKHLKILFRLSNSTSATPVCSCVCVHVHTRVHIYTLHVYEDNSGKSVLAFHPWFEAGSLVCCSCPALCSLGLWVQVISFGQQALWPPEPSPRSAFVSVNCTSVSYHGNLSELVRCRFDPLIFDILPPPHVFSLSVLPMPVASFTRDDGICFLASLESNLPGWLWQATWYNTVG